MLTEVFIVVWKKNQQPVRTGLTYFTTLAAAEAWLKSRWNLKRTSHYEIVKFVRNEP